MAKREWVTEGMGMPKVMRQMPEQCRRAAVAHGEAEREAASDEACGPPHEHPGKGSAKLKVGAGTLLEASLRAVRPNCCSLAVP